MKEPRIIVYAHVPALTMAGVAHWMVAGQYVERSSYSEVVRTCMLTLAQNYKIKCPQSLDDARELLQVSGFPTDQLRDVRGPVAVPPMPASVEDQLLTPEAVNEELRRELEGIAQRMKEEQGSE